MAMTMNNYEIEAALKMLGAHDAIGGKKRITNNLRRAIDVISDDRSLNPELVRLLSGIADRIDDDWKTDCLYWRNRGHTEMQSGVDAYRARQNFLLRKAIRYVLFDQSERIPYEVWVEMCDHIRESGVNLSCI